jgi:hypothetical protein
VKCSVYSERKVAYKEKYGDLALQVGGVSDETVKYGYGSWATLTSE